MKSIWVVLFLIGCTVTVAVSVKEKVDYSSFLNDKLIQEIQKRLSEMDADNSDKCEFTTENNTIIRTHDSQDAGAIFLKAPTANTKGECQQQCCEMDQCSLAVFKEQDDHACYLFDCGHPNHCVFTPHDGFASMTVAQRPEKHADDLEKLAQDWLTTTTLAPTTTTTPPPTTTHRPTQSVPLFGDCAESEDCAGVRAECLAGYCICQEGYHAQDGICRIDCNRFEFECANEGQPLVYPQCIAIYDKCDGTQHCADNSDEQNCPPQLANQHDKAGAVKPNTSEEDNAASQTEPSEALKTQNPLPVYKPKPHSYGKDGAKPTEKVASPDADMSVSSPTTTTTTSSTTLPPSSTPPSSTTDSNKVENNGPHKAVNTAVVHQHNSVGNHATAEKNLFLGASNRGAVIALSLGLAITAMLLIFVGCRLRNVKRRLRKGRPLNSNEADYLINGMYL